MALPDGSLKADGLVLELEEKTPVGVESAPEIIDALTHLGYPAYLAKILGTWKLLGVVALLAPGFRRVKEWAYAGFFFNLTGATLSHLASGCCPGPSSTAAFPPAPEHSRPEQRCCSAATPGGEGVGFRQGIVHITQGACGPSAASAF